MRVPRRRTRPVPPSNATRYLSPEQEAKAREMLLAGFSRDMAAQVIGVSSRLLAARLEDQLADLRVGQGRGKKTRQPDPTPEEIRERAAAVRRTWSPEEEEARRLNFTGPIDDL